MPAKNCSVSGRTQLSYTASCVADGSQTPSKRKGLGVTRSLAAEPRPPVVCRSTPATMVLTSGWMTRQGKLHSSISRALRLQVRVGWRQWDGVEPGSLAVMNQTTRAYRLGGGLLTRAGARTRALSRARGPPSSTAATGFHTDAAGREATQAQTIMPHTDTYKENFLFSIPQNCTRVLRRRAPR